MKRARYGVGTNQYQIKPPSSSSRQRPTAATQLACVNRDPSTRIRTVIEHLKTQRRAPKVVIKQAWKRAHPNEPVPEHWHLIFTCGQLPVLDGPTLLQLELLCHDQAEAWWAENAREGEVYATSEGLVAHLVYNDSSEAWLRNGLWHNPNGPARRFPDGQDAYYFNGRPIDAAVLHKAAGRDGGVCPTR